MGRAGSLELMSVIGPQYVQIDTRYRFGWGGDFSGSTPTVRRRAFLPGFPHNLTRSHIMASRARLVQFSARAAMHALLVVRFPRY